MRYRSLISALSIGLCLHAQRTTVATFTENKGQWPAQVLYRALIPGGALYVEKDALTYSLYQGGPMMEHAHDASFHEEPFRAHAYRVTFEHAQVPRGEGGLKQKQYENFFLGSDATNWGTGCGVFGEVWLRDLYAGIDLHIDGRQGLKYEFIVSPGADPSAISMRFDGQDALQLADGRLTVKTTAGDVTEEKPVSYTEASIGRMNVPCAYTRAGDRVRFKLMGYRDSTAPLVIDPTLTFGSYTGSQANNFGFTATYDNDGALYGGGIAFGTGYPVTLGVQQGAFAGGNIDVGISKWTPDGTNLEWSTYIGGTNNETPTSLVVNSNNELFLLAITGSSNYPTTTGCFDSSFNGGVTIPMNGGFVNLLGGEGYAFSNGTDIAITHFSADCTSLIGSTFVGGSANDGLNQSAALVHNYGDHFRGEIALDANGDPVIGSSTQSLNAPTTPGAAQGSFGGGVQDAYLFRLNASLTSMLFGTYCGGNGDESGFGVQFASNGEIYLTGGTSSSDLPMAGTPFDATYSGSNDGYLMRYDANAQTLLSSTYVGTSGYDETYFVQLNTNDEVYVVGQTHGAYPVTPGKYAVPGSSQFIHKFSHDLSTSLWSTRIGSGNGLEDISPSAFLVSDCGQIYFSGWGGTVNHNVLALSSTTVGLPVTADAFQHTTDGSDYWLLVLEPEAVALNYATFIGGDLSPEHVDGGTSRFDKHGNVYQAVCAGCWNNSDFPTTPGAWSNTNNGGFGACNLAVFKFNLSHPVAQIGINGPNYVCLPNSAQFVNNSIGGSTYQWNFGDNGSSTAFAPQHTYTDTGLFTVTMVLSDSDSCTPNDTAHITIAVVNPLDAGVDPVDTVCQGGSVQLHAHGGHAFAWFPSAGLSDTTIANPICTPTGPTTYHVLVTDSCGTDTAMVFVPFSIPFGHASSDTTICLGGHATISAVGGGTYVWSPIASLNSATAQSPTATPIDTTQFNVTITTPQGCVAHDSVVVNVVQSLPPVQTSDTAICYGTQAQLHARGGEHYQWQPAAGINSLTVPDQTVTPTTSTDYVVLVSNACGGVSDTAFVNVLRVLASAWPDTMICIGQSVTIGAAGGTHYAWSPSASLAYADSAHTLATPSGTTDYSVIVSNDIGCTDTAFALVQLFPPTPVYAGPEHTIAFGDSAQLQASGNGSLVWITDPSLSCDSCADPFAAPDQSTTYTVQLTDIHGCKATASTIVFVEGSLYVPNTFTPDGDGINDVFFAQGTEVKDFHIYVFNRWGEDIFETDRINKPWDGTYNGTQSPIDTYVWRIDLTETDGHRRSMLGHVNLVR